MRRLVLNMVCRFPRDSRRITHSGITHSGRALVREFSHSKPDPRKVPGIRYVPRATRPIPVTRVIPVPPVPKTPDDIPLETRLVSLGKKVLDAVVFWIWVIIVFFFIQIIRDLLLFKN